MATLDLKSKIAATPRGPSYEVGQSIPLDQIRMDGGTQARAGLDNQTLAEYAESWLTLSHRQNGFLEMPLIIVYHDGESYWLADGFHRVVAYRQFLDGGSASASPRAIRAEVRMGTKRDAVLYACGANATHGLKRTQADKRRAIETLLGDEEWKQWSDSEIARRCNVTHPTVAAVRRDLYPENLQDSRTVERNGTTYQQKPPAPKPNISDQPMLPNMPDPPTPSDVPAEYAIVQRRLAAHGITLLSNMQGHHRAFVTRKEGMTGVVTFDWADVLSKLERLEAMAAPPDPSPPTLTVNGTPRPGPMHGLAPNPYLKDVHPLPDPAHARALEEQIESDRIPEAGMQIEPQPIYESDGWYTPQWMVDAARTTMGSIDTDPATCAAAQAIVQAETWYTAAENGLTQPWSGHVWCNPPYSNPMPWAERMVALYQSGAIGAGMMLVNCTCSPKWARLLWRQANAVCLLSSRIDFWHPSKSNANGSYDRDSALFYFGADCGGFVAAFSGYGVIQLLKPVLRSGASRDQILATIPTGRQITLALSFDECAALRKEARAFESSGLTKKLPTIGQALALLIEGMRGAQ